MKNELQALEHIVTVDLNPKNFNDQKNKNSFIKKCAEIISAEVERIIRSLVFEIINCGIEKQVICYVHQHQLGIINLLDAQQSYLLKDSTKSICKFPALKVYINYYKNILAKLEEILKLIKDNFKLYYQKEYKIADCVRLSFSLEVKKILTDASTILRKNEIDERLIKLLKSPFEYCISLANFMNQKDLGYFLLFKNEVKKLLTRESMNSFDIYSLLIKINLNDPAFTFYYIETLKESETIDSLKDRLEYYYLQLKIINQVVKITGLAFDPSLSSVADQIGTWLAEEIYFLEKKQKLEYYSAARDEESAKVSKLQTNLSVAHLSLAVKLLLDTGVIKSKNTKLVLRMVSKNFKTENTDNISEDSLRNKAYNIESSAIEGVKNVIVGLLNEVRKY